MVADRVVLRRDWLAPLIHSMMATGNFGKLCDDAINKAYADKRTADVTLYRNMQGQIADYFAQMGDDET